MSDVFPEGHVFAGLRRHHYKCLIIDPPTRFVAGTKGRPQHYERMTDVEISQLPVGELLHPDGAWAFLWVTSPKLYAPKNSKKVLAPDDMMRPYGLRYSGRAFTWIKLKRNTPPSADNAWIINTSKALHIGMGFTTRKNAEDVLLFRSGMPQRLARDVREVIIAPAREHSRKPDEVFNRIERFCPGPRLELFGRETRSGWDAWGNEINKFNLDRGAVAQNSLLMRDSDDAATDLPEAA